MRIAIHTDSAHEHPHLHHHILWAVFAMIVFVFLFVRAVAGEAMTTTSGTIAAAPERDYLWYRESDFKADENLLLNRPVIVASSVITPDGAQLVIR